MSTTAFPDALTTAADPQLPEGFFDRFMFNLHPVDGSGPSIVVGAGVYPPRNIIDGFAVLTDVGPLHEQRNLRFSTTLSSSDGEGVGPLTWSVVTPMERWRLRLDDPGSRVLLDVEWRGRAPAWSGAVVVDNPGGRPTSFDHLFQSGRVDGRLVVDDVETAIQGWYSQRDRSRGVRTMAGGQGLHIWLQAQFPAASVGFMLVDSRDGTRSRLEGAVMRENGALDPIVEVTHDLEFDELLDLRGGRVVVTTESGEVWDLGADASSRGGYLAGGGYGGFQGADHGVDHIERDRYPLDGSVGPRLLDVPLTDRLTRFTRRGADEGDRHGSGIFEFAHSRSAAYRYRRTAD